MSYFSSSSSVNSSKLDNSNEANEDYEDADESSNGDLKQKQSRMLVNRNFNQVQRRNISQLAENKEATVASSPAAAAAAIAVVATSPEKPSSFECPYCTYQSNGNDADYLFHVKDHLCGKTFRCVLCNSVYKYRGDCVVHLKRKHQKADTIAHSYVDKFNLDSLDITQINALLKPKQNDDFDNEEKLFGCAYCDYKANYKGDVFKHQTRRHPGTVKSVNALASNLNTSYNNHNGSTHSSENNSVNNSFNCNGNANKTANANINHNNNNNNNNKSGLANGGGYGKMNHQQHSHHHHQQQQQQQQQRVVVNNSLPNAVQATVVDADDYDELIINPEIYKTNHNGNGFFLDDDDDGRSTRFFFCYA